MTTVIRNIQKVLYFCLFLLLVQTVLDLYKLFLAGPKAIFHLIEFYLLNHVQKVKRPRQASRFSCNNFFYKPKFGSFFCLIRGPPFFHFNMLDHFTKIVQFEIGFYLSRKKKLEFCKKKCYPEFRSLIFQI